MIAGTTIAGTVVVGSVVVGSAIAGTVIERVLDVGLMVAGVLLMVGSALAGGWTKYLIHQRGDLRAAAWWLLGLLASALLGVFLFVVGAGGPA